MTFISSQTEYSYVYNLRTKDEAFEIFKEFKRQVELNRKLKIEELRTDNGGEYMTDDFKHYLKTNGIIHNTSVHQLPIVLKATVKLKDSIEP